MDLVKDLVVKVKEEFAVCINDYNTANPTDQLTPAHLKNLYEWMINEYKKYFFLSREVAEVTIGKMIDKYPDYKPFFDCLLSHIEEYGSMQGFYRVAMELTAELELIIA